MSSKEDTKDKKNVRVLIGKVLSSGMDKTITVLVERKIKHPVYGKYIKRSTKIHAHDENNVCNKGDTVSISESRPISRTKKWRLVEVITEAVRG